MLMPDGGLKALSGLPLQSLRGGLFQGFNFLTTHTEEVTEQRGAFITQYAFCHLNPVIHARMMQYIH